MANINFVSIRKRIREVLDDGEGLLRTVTAGRVSGDYWSGSTVWQGRTRALSKPRFALPTMSYGPNAQGPSERGSLAIYRIEPVLESEYSLPAEVDTDDNRDATVATAETDADVFRQALGWPPNMTDTEGGSPTGIIGGLRFIDFSVVEENWDERRLRTVHRYEGLVTVTLSVV